MDQDQQPYYVYTMSIQRPGDRERWLWTKNLTIDEAHKWKQSADEQPGNDGAIIRLHRSDVPVQHAQFKHNCGMCKFLGRYTFEGKPCDLYYCAAYHDRIVIRWEHGNIGALHTRDTYSMIGARSQYINQNTTGYPPVVEAFKRATNAGYLSYYISSEAGGL